MSERTKVAIFSGSCFLVAIMLLVGLLRIEAGKQAPAPSLPLACADCLIGCVCGDCAKCTPAPAACKCEPHRPCPCPAPPVKSGRAVVNVICCFCKHGFSVPAYVVQTQCPSCLAPLVVHPGSTGQVGATKKDDFPPERFGRYSVTPRKDAAPR